MTIFSPYNLKWNNVLMTPFSHLILEVLDNIRHGVRVLLTVQNEGVVVGQRLTSVEAVHVFVGQSVILSLDPLPRKVSHRKVLEVEPLLGGGLCGDLDILRHLLCHIVPDIKPINLLQHRGEVLGAGPGELLPCTECLIEVKMTFSDIAFPVVPITEHDPNANKPYQSPFIKQEEINFLIEY